MTTPTPYMTDLQLAERYSINRTTIWRWARKGTFPRPVQLSSCCTRWHIDDILAWEAAIWEDILLEPQPPNVRRMTQAAKGLFIKVTD